MSNSLTVTSPFDQIKKTDNGNEYWSARELKDLLGYTEWRKFEDAIERAKVAAKNSGLDENGVITQFVGAAKMVEQGCGAQREIKDYHLSRYACYLVAMNGDPRKEKIAAAQTYFAVKTREAEVRPMSTEEIVAYLANQNVETVRKLRDHDKRLIALDSFTKDQRQTNAAIEDTLQKQQQQITRIATRAATIPDEYPPVNITERNRMSRKAGALCKFIGETTGNTVGEIQNSLKAQIVSIFEDQFQINLYAVLEEAKKWYMYHYISLKSEDPNNVPHDVLRPKDIKSLSLYAAISLNKSWIDYFDQAIDNAFENYREEVESDV